MKTACFIPIKANSERVPELARNTANGNDLLVFHGELFPQYDYYFQLFATAPYLKPESIRACYNALLSSEEYDSCFTATENHGFYWLADNAVTRRSASAHTLQYSIIGTNDRQSGCAA